MSLSRRAFLQWLALGAGGAVFTACAPRRPPSGAPSAVTASPVSTQRLLFQTHLTTRAEGQHFIVESNGLPAHNMMVGIRSWQQQVPLPQPYTGDNAWRIPLQPVLADTPISAKTALYRGAIALAVNGVPIFNALNNRGEDAHAIGELDEWGGHAGRADDYHYHVAPLHLQVLVGAHQPIAYALDGFPIYGATEADGSAVSGLDAFNGHFDPAGQYHYHGTETYPYINGGLRGVVTVRDDQVEPQPRLTPIRPFLQPLNGATITGFESAASNRYALTYSLNSGTYQVNYRLEDETYTFEFVDPAGNTRTETYQKSG